ncbi:MAG: TetR/AcrR family transcriptional regulator [Bacteroidales bacterium]|nr:TetR/AcrR family transcriptional regulator [Bacteroidales bacterium]MBR1645057.1 TetR/AcrR family transcriptional regulator [Bacteroidales bacterium]
MQGNKILWEDRELQQRIVHAAQKLFFEKGLREVTMDDVSHELRISKRTLYQVVRDKEELILLCYQADADEQEETLNRHLEANDDVLDILLKQIEHRISQIASIPLSAIAEMAKYPRLIEAVRKRHHDNEERVLRFIKAGVEQGLIEPDIDFRVLLRTLNSMASRSDSMEQLEGYTPKQIFMSSVFILLRGCTTEEGRRRLDHFRKNF